MSTTYKTASDTSSGNEGEEGELPHKLVRSQLEMLWSGECADCVVKCNSLEWAVHKSVLINRCTWFKKAVAGGFQEAKTSILDMAEEDPHAVEGLLIYIYTLEYPNWSDARKDDKEDERGRRSLRSSKSTIPAAQWQTHLGLIQLADKICLRRLKAMAKKRLKSVMHEEWTLGNFHLLLDQLWHMEQGGMEEVKAVALKVASAHAAELMVKHKFLELLSGDSTFNIDFVNHLIGGVQGSARASTDTENELNLARQKSEHNQRDMQKVVDSWQFGHGANASNRARVVKVLEGWDETGWL